MKFNEVLREEIDYRGIVLKKFAKQIDVPYRTLIGYISKEQNNPSVEYLFKIAKGLNVTIEYLLTGEEKYNYLSQSDVTIRKLVSLPPPLYKQVISFINLLYEMTN
ncbi:MAG: helix-turn-helix domain-containing protein [Treponema sp.]|uniref:helix-turn-helix domain-containing protein n=1 Tax=Treponema sp. TaxID=166 RepID=UPI00298E4280|nr:helix-turn-helix transcriptional regulator [Treponema sp.]MCQ2600912.1 helix-turn-helix domain-containing protein [Treponema sp.]